MLTFLLPLLLAIPLTGEGDFSAPPQEKTEKQVTVRVKQGKQGFLGVQIRDLDSEQAAELKVKAEEGALVVDVTSKSPAEKAGILKDDVILQFNGRTISDSEDLIKAVRRLSPGTEASVLLERKGEKKTLKVTVGKGKGDPMTYAFTVPHPLMRRERKFISIQHGMYGLQLHELTPQLGSYFGAPEGRGVLVEDVEKESAGAKAGFQAGDVILRIGSEPIEDVGDIQDGLEDFKEGEKAEVEVLRKGARTTLTLPVEEELSWKEERLPGMEGLQELEELQPEMNRLRLNLNGMKDELRDAMKQFRVSLKRRLERTTV